MLTKKKKQHLGNLRVCVHWEYGKRMAECKAGEPVEMH